MDDDYGDGWFDEREYDDFSDMEAEAESRQDAREFGGPYDEENDRDGDGEGAWHEIREETAFRSSEGGKQGMDWSEFGWKDAAILGGIAGFIEQSLREENERYRTEPEEERDFDIDDSEQLPVSLKTELRRLAASDPRLARYAIDKVREQKEQWALQSQEKRFALAVKDAYERQDEEEKKGFLSNETMSDALTEWSRYKWGGLTEEEHERHPELYWLGEAISEEWKVVLDYRKMDGKWEEGLLVQPKRFAKNKGQIYLHGFCDKWKKEYYFMLDRTRNMKLA